MKPLVQVYGDSPVNAIHSAVGYLATMRAGLKPGEVLHFDVRLSDGTTNEYVFGSHNHVGTAYTIVTAVRS